MKAVRTALLGELDKLKPGRRRIVAIVTGIVAVVFALFAALALLAPTLRGGEMTSGLIGAIVLAVGAAWFAWIALLAGGKTAKG